MRTQHGGGGIIIGHSIITCAHTKSNTLWIFKSNIWINLNLNQYLTAASEEAAFSKSWIALISSSGSGGSPAGAADLSAAESSPFSDPSNPEGECRISLICCEVVFCGLVCFSPSRVTNSFLFCWLSTIKGQCGKVKNAKVPLYFKFWKQLMKLGGRVLKGRNGRQVKILKKW